MPLKRESFIETSISIQTTGSSLLKSNHGSNAVIIIDSGFGKSNSTCVQSDGSISSIVWYEWRKNSDFVFGVIYLFVTYEFSIFWFIIGPASKITNHIFVCCICRSFDSRMIYKYFIHKLYNISNIWHTCPQFCLDSVHKHHIPTDYLHPHNTFYYNIIILILLTKKKQNQCNWHAK